MRLTCVWDCLMGKSPLESRSPASSDLSAPQWSAPEPPPDPSRPVPPHRSPPGPLCGPWPLSLTPIEACEARRCCRLRCRRHRHTVSRHRLSSNSSATSAATPMTTACGTPTCAPKPARGVPVNMVVSRFFKSVHVLLRCVQWFVLARFHSLHWYFHRK